MPTNAQLLHERQALHDQREEILDYRIRHRRYHAYTDYNNRQLHRLSWPLVPMLLLATVPAWWVFIYHAGVWYLIFYRMVHLHGSLVQLVAVHGT